MCINLFMYNCIMKSFEEKLIVFEEKLKKLFDAKVLSIDEQINKFQIRDTKGQLYADDEQDTTKLVNIYIVYNERVKLEWTPDFAETENYILLWLFKYDRPGIYRITYSVPSEKLESFIRDSNSYFINKKVRYYESL